MVSLHSPSPPSHPCDAGSTSGAPPFHIAPADAFTIDELVAAYNQTRVDYIVPMPMNATRLAEYVHHYDVDMGRSAVALDDGDTLGLAMLGVRPGHTWITRLGVLPHKRKHGTGRALMQHLIDQSRQLEVPYIILEVIMGNDPAERLFHELGFKAVRELLIVRRPPGPSSIDAGPYTVQILDHPQTVALLDRRHSIPSWLDEAASLNNAGGLAALRVDLPGEEWGWIVYQPTTFQLSRLVLQTEHGDPRRVGRALAHALHARHPTSDTKSENLPVDDPHWPALQELGYFESFRRIEMRLDL